MALFQTASTALTDVLELVGQLARLHLRADARSGGSRRPDRAHPRPALRQRRHGQRQSARLGGRERVGHRPRHQRPERHRRHLDPLRRRRHPWRLQPADELQADRRHGHAQLGFAAARLRVDLHGSAGPGAVRRHQRGGARGPSPILAKRARPRVGSPRGGPSAPEATRPTPTGACSLRASTAKNTTSGPRSTTPVNTDPTGLHRDAGDITRRRSPRGS